MIFDYPVPVSREADAPGEVVVVIKNQKADPAHHIPQPNLKGICRFFGNFHFIDKKGH